MQSLDGKRFVPTQCGVERHVDESLCSRVMDVERRCLDVEASRDRRSYGHFADGLTLDFGRSRCFLGAGVQIDELLFVEAGAVHHAKETALFETCLAERQKQFFGVPVKVGPVRAFPDIGSLHMVTRIISYSRHHLTRIS